MIVIMGTSVWIFLFITRCLAASAAVNRSTHVDISNDNTLASGNSGTKYNGNENALHLQGK